MRRGGFSKWLGLGLLWCACARAPTEEELSVPAPPAQAGTAPSPSPSTPEQSSGADASTDAGVADAGVADAGVVVTAPPAQDLPPGACGRSERTFLAESLKGTLIGASKQGRILLFHEDGTIDGLTRIHDTASGHDTSTTASFSGFSADEHRVLLIEPSPGGGKRLLELDAATGTVREPIEGAQLIDGGGLWLLGTSDGRRWLYERDTGGLLPLVSTPPAHPRIASTVDGARILSLDAGSAVLWDVATGKHWRTPPAQDAFVLPNGSGAVYVDAQERAWGWTPSTPPVLLGHQSLSTPPAGFLDSSQSPVTGAVVFVNSEGSATLWNPHAGTARGLGSDVVSAMLSASGTWLVLVRHPSGQDFSLSAQRLPEGPETTLWHGPRLEYLQLNASGSRLAFEVPAVRPGADPDLLRWKHRLWNVEAGTEVDMPNGHWSSDEYPFWFSFREDFDMLYVSDWAHSDAMYSASTGALLFDTVHGATPGEESHSLWGPDGVFYGQYNEYQGPTATGLYAWNPATGIETLIATGTISLCFSGARHVLTSGMDRWGDVSHGTLQVWDPVTRSSETLATDVNFASCAPPRNQVVYFTDWKRGSWDNEPGVVSVDQATLNVADPARSCHQPLATKVERRIDLDDSIVYQSDGKVWRVSLP